jgi:hypothetical protein
MRRFSSLLVATACLAGLGAAAPALADVTVQPVTGNDATCSDGGPPCASISGAVSAAAAAPGRTIIRLGTGIYAISGNVVMSDDWIVGAGGVQTLLRMVGGQARLTLRGTGAVVSVAMSGDRAPDGSHPDAWLGLYGNAAALNVVVTRTGPGSLVSANGSAALRNVMLRADPDAEGTAMGAYGPVTMADSLVSGGEVYATGSGAAGAQRSQALRVNRSLLGAGMRMMSGDVLVTNSIVLTEPHPWATPPAITLASFPLNPDEPRTAQVQIALSTVWQSDCREPIRVVRSANAANMPTLILAGSLAGSTCAGGGMGGSTVRVESPPGAVNAWYQLVLARPYLARVQAAGRPDTTFSPQPLPCCAWVSQDPAPLTGTTPRIVRMPDALTGAAPVDFMPTAGSPLLRAATDPWSAQVAATWPSDFSGTARPAANQTIGAFESVAGAVVPFPVPQGVGVVPVPAGGFAPAAGDLPGGVAVPGAPMAGQIDPNAPSVQVPDSIGNAVRIQLRVPKRSKVSAAFPVTVTADQAARVVVVVRRPVQGAGGVSRSRVLAKGVATFTTAGTKVVRLRFKPSTQRGSVVVGATGRHTGRDPGMDSAASFLTGPAPLSLVAPSNVHAGANRISVKVNRAGNIVIVGRTATGRVIGRTAFTAASRGTRRVTLRLSPARLVTGAITISARAAGGEPVTLTRSAG